MSTSQFKIINHTAKGSFTREWPRSLVNSDTQIPKLAVKQYIPLNNLHPKYGDVTIIATHATGLPKEIYEPLWTDILNLTEQESFKIRSIWIADYFNHGQSGLLNADILGNDPCATDHARDLLIFINDKRVDMSQPLIGIGHSGGAWQIIDLATFHPSLLKSVILMEPGIEPPNPGFNIAKATLGRKDRWPSKDAAMEEFKQSKYFRKWDQRCLNIFCNEGLIETKSNEVNLITSKHQEVATCIRPVDNVPHNTLQKDAFERPETIRVYERLPYLKSSFLYLFGEKSGFWSKHKEEITTRTGTSRWGSGGITKGKGKAITIQDASHMMPIEKVHECAVNIVEFLAVEVERWKDEDAKIEKEWRMKDRTQQLMADKRIINAFEDNKAKQKL